MTANSQTAQIAYGKRRIPLRMESRLAEWEVIAPKFEPAHPDPLAGFIEAVRNPIGARPLREIVGAGDRVCVVTSDGTRPVPNRQLIPWILDELPCPAENVTVLLGTGTHRPNTPEEIERMFGADCVKRVRIVNHDAFNPESNRKIGTAKSGAEAFIDKAWLEADRRIVVGFIEPHFFAGFSGGPKGIIPGVAGIDTILHLHNFDLIGHPNSSFGILDGNPIHEEVAEMAAMAPPDFMVNVTLNGEKKIGAFYCGDYMEAHRAGCARVKESSMAPVEREFEIVVTSNSGFPLDQNLYQTVKGISAAARIVKQGGAIVVASECSDGIPAHGRFGALLREGGSAQGILANLRSLDKPILDQWQAQILSTIRLRCEVALHSGLDGEATAMCGLPIVENLQEDVERRLAALGRGARVAVLPDGPLTIPYVASAA